MVKRFEPVTICPFFGNEWVESKFLNIFWWQVPRVTNNVFCYHGTYMLTCSFCMQRLDSDMQTLVYENYNKFIAATETIRNCSLIFEIQVEGSTKITSSQSSREPATGVRYRTVPSVLLIRCSTVTVLFTGSRVFSRRLPCMGIRQPTNTKQSIGKHSWNMLNMTGSSLFRKLKLAYYLDVVWSVFVLSYSVYPGRAVTVLSNMGRIRYTSLRRI